MPADLRLLLISGSTLHGSGYLDHEDNELKVVGSRKGSMLWIEKATVSLKGVTAERLFEKGRKPVEAMPGGDLDHLLD
jgi:hypothetical protein